MKFRIAASTVSKMLSSAEDDAVLEIDILGDATALISIVGSNQAERLGKHFLPVGFPSSKSSSLTEKFWDDEMKCLVDKRR